MGSFYFEGLFRASTKKGAGLGKLFTINVCTFINPIVISISQSFKKKNVG
jgi:hypothetical protein